MNQLRKSDQSNQNSGAPQKHLINKYLRGISILLEDREIIIIDKPAGLLTMGNDREREQTAYYILTNYVRQGNPKSPNRLFIVHRIDRDTSGVLLFAKSEKSKRFLQDNWQQFTKKYYAVVSGKMTEREGVIESYLAENNVYRVYSVKKPELGKYSKTGFRVIKENRYFSLVEIELFTGTKHQIRVQFAERGNPVAGDRIYGHESKKMKRMTLHAASLSFVHPVSGELISVNTQIPSYFNEMVR